ncbi:MAG TPA: tRNA (adenosine(37)-N6)-threonylcarbamoyltransferase complex ATPase subunit type 1 TsaE [Acidimicrobiales bacterium]|jgi:tRNA threonylcarbamoyladenosine biosynthesis protein TsaE|nr:tRNA (adenosine(37)-N6)-threonylcarbamoyltransferase complex ATPase subunit type 1 TsaE [Acidimicrobiales bacterium]
MITLATKSVDDTRALAAEVASLARPGDLIVLAGDLGTGKTAFAQGFAKGLGVDEPVTSPAFILVRTYEGRLPLVHLDVYRLDHIQELVDLGIAELLDEGAVTLVEWGDAVTPALPADFLEVRLDWPDDAPPDDRRLSIRSVGPAWPPRADGLRSVLARWTVA